MSLQRPSPQQGAAHSSSHLFALKESLLDLLNHGITLHTREATGGFNHWSTQTQQTWTQSGQFPKNEQIQINNPQVGAWFEGGSNVFHQPGSSLIPSVSDLGQTPSPDHASVSPHSQERSDAFGISRVIWYEDISSSERSLYSPTSQNTSHQNSYTEADINLPAL